MGKYIGKRLLMLIPVIIGVSFLIYFIMDLAPGDVISQLAPDNATTEQIEALRAQYGYDRSVFYRYAIYMQGLFRGNLGVSFLTGQPVWEMYMQRLPATLSLTLGRLLYPLQSHFRWEYFLPSTMDPLETTQPWCWLCWGYPCRTSGWGFC